MAREKRKKNERSSVGITGSTRQEVPPHYALEHRRLPGTLDASQTQTEGGWAPYPDLAAMALDLRGRYAGWWRARVPGLRRRRRRAAPPRGNPPRRRPRGRRGRCTPAGSGSPARSGSPSSPSRAKPPTAYPPNGSARRRCSLRLTGGSPEHGGGGGGGGWDLPESGEAEAREIEGKIFFSTSGFWKRGLCKLREEGGGDDERCVDRVLVHRDVWAGSLHVGPGLQRRTAGGPQGVGEQRRRGGRGGLGGPGAWDGSRWIRVGREPTGGVVVGPWCLVRDAWAAPYLGGWSVRSRWMGNRRSRWDRLTFGNSREEWRKRGTTSLQNIGAFLYLTIISFVLKYNIF